MTESMDAVLMGGGYSCFSSSSDGRFKVGGRDGQVWLLETVEDKCRWRRSMLGDFELVSSTIPIRIEVVEVEDRVFVFAGVLKQTQRAFKAWQLGPRREENGGFVGGCEVKEFELSVPREGKLRGFGDAVFCEKDAAGRVYKFRIACGLGIGKAHFWELDMDLETYKCKQTYLGSVMARHNSITAIRFAKNGELLVTVTIEKLMQLWNLKTLKEEAGGEVFNGSSRFGLVIREDQFLEHFPQQQELDLVNLLHQEFSERQSDLVEQVTSHEAWRFIFNSEEDDDFYEGDLNRHGQPHGYGVLFFQDQDSKRLVYRGNWSEGRKQGFGSLVDDETGQVIFKGTWDGNQRHGKGWMISDTEEFDGYFEQDRPHGFGVLKVRKTKMLSFEDNTRKKKRRREQGESYTGFWKNGHFHGVGVWEFPSRSNSLNKENPNALVQFGRIRCHTIHEQDVLVRELNFHRADKMEIAVEERSLLEKGTSKKRNNSFQLERAYCPNPRGLWLECGTCWYCCKKSSTCRDFLQCETCSFLVHTSCSKKILEKDNMTCPFCVVLNNSERQNWLQQRTEAAISENADFDRVVAAAKETASSTIGIYHNEDDDRELEDVRLQNHNKRKRRAPPTAEKKVSNDEHFGAVRAKKIIRKAMKARTKLQHEFFAKLLAHQRLEEIQTRRGWSCQMNEKQGEIQQLESEVNQIRSELVNRQLQLSRFQGQDLQAMKLSELDTLQDQVDAALDACRQALEIATSSKMKHFAASSMTA